MTAAAAGVGGGSRDGESRDGGSLGRPRRRLVLWISLGAAALLAALLAVFAVAPQATVQVQSPLLGKPAPSLSGAVINGSGQASLASLRGRWVLVNFFASWCTPCQEEMPQLKDFQSAQARTGAATILGVEYDSTDVGNARTFLADQKADWPVVSDDAADVQWGVHGIPESYLVAPDGLIVVKYAGGITAASLDAQISRLGGALSGTGS